MNEEDRRMMQEKIVDCISSLCSCAQYWIPIGSITGMELSLKAAQAHLSELEKLFKNLDKKGN